MSNRIFFIVGIISLMAAPLQAQNPQKYIREGNELFEKKEYSEAETSYLKALKTDSAFIKGKFNRADALYEQENYQEAAGIFEDLTVENLGPKDKAAVWHNLGNSLTQSKAYKEAAEAYKEALRLHPDDMDTKYNLTYALEKLKEQEKQNQNQNQNQDQNKDQEQQQDQNQDQQKQDQQNQDQQQDKQEKNDNNKQKEKQNQQNKQQQQPKPQEISGEEAKRMLEALKNNEQETLKKLKRIKAKGEKTETEKDW